MADGGDETPFYSIRDNTSTTLKNPMSKPKKPSIGYDKTKKNAFPAKYTKAGYLDIRKHIKKPWKRRYFVLNNNFLLVGSTPFALKLEAVIPLEGSNTNISTSDMTFSLKQRKDTLYFRAPSPQECKIWMKHIKQASTLKIKDIYRFLFTLGTSESQMTKVVAAQHRTTQQSCAIKIVNKRTCDRQMLNTEIKILKKLNSNYIVELFETFETKQWLYIVMEKCEGGELFDQIAELDGDHYTEQECCQIMHQIASGVKYMHSMGIIHRDLKPENILCVYPNSITKLKIADFGISKMIKSSKQQMKTLCGTLSYSAPEILRGKGYDKSIDYWSIGVIMYILLCGYPPFWGETESEISHSILKDDVEYDEDDWGHVTKHTKILVEGLLNKNPKKRKNIDDCLKITWKVSSLHSIAFPKGTRNKFKQTVIKRKLQRQSLSAFEHSTSMMRKIGYKTSIINQYNAVRKSIRKSKSTKKLLLNRLSSIHSNKKKLIDIEDEKELHESFSVPLNGQPKTFRTYLRKIKSVDDSIVKRNRTSINLTRNINAFCGKRGSKACEVLELQLPMTKRETFVGPVTNKKNSVGFNTLGTIIDDEETKDSN